MAGSKGRSRNESPEVRWIPRLKTATAAKAAGSDAAKVALSALADMKTIEKVRSGGGDVEHVCERLTRKGDRRKDGVERPVAPATGRPAGTLVMVVAGVALAVTVVAGVFAVRGMWRSHSVAGTIRLEKKPIPNAKVVFHALLSGDPVGETTTTETGSFKLDSLSPGVYRVTVNGVAGGKTPVPAAYTSPDSTPFQLIVRQDIRDVAMIAVRD
jgi:hypothetical protein